MELLNSLLLKLHLKQQPPAESSQEPEIPPPKDIQEVIDRLPEAYKKFRQRELPYRLASAVAFIILCILCGTLAWKNTQVYRAPMKNLPIDLRKIDLEVTVHVVPTNKAILEKVPLLEERILARLNEGDLPITLNIKWNIRCHGFRELTSLQTNKDKGLNVYLALVDSTEWTHFSANHAFLSCSQWVLIQFGEDLEKTAQRIGSLIWEVLVDIPHLESIIKRDQRELMPAWQIATLPLSHQKRLVWDSAALAGEYVVQIVHLHQNTKLSKEVEQRSTATVNHFWRFASRIRNVTRLQITSEHLWDFEVMHYLEKDVQDRWTLSADSTQNVIKEVDMQMQTVESASPVLKMIILESEVPVIILDHTGEDSRGVAVASWGALVSRNDKTDAHLLTSLRVLLGMDSELEGGRAREPCPVNEWEIMRMHLRAFVDNTLRTRSAIRALHSMKNQIPDIGMNSTQKRTAITYETKKQVIEGKRGGKSAEELLSLVKKIIDYSDAGTPFEIDLLMALWMMRRAWEAVTQETISNCFTAARFLKSEVDLEDESSEVDPDSYDSELHESWNSLIGKTTIDDDYFHYSEFFCHR